LLNCFEGAQLSRAMLLLIFFVILRERERACAVSTTEGAAF